MNGQGYRAPVEFVIAKIEGNAVRLAVGGIDLKVCVVAIVEVGLDAFGGAVRVLDLQGLARVARCRPATPDVEQSLIVLDGVQAGIGRHVHLEIGEILAILAVNALPVAERGRVHPQKGDGWRLREGHLQACCHQESGHNQTSQSHVALPCCWNLFGAE